MPEFTTTEAQVSSPGIDPGEQVKRYTFEYTKKVTDVNGVEFDVKDEGRTVTQTEAEIITQREIYQAEVDKCNQRLAEIAKLKGE